MSTFEDHQFKPGEGGRKLGSRNRLGEAFLKDLKDEWQVGGRDVLKILRIENPEAFARLVATVIPREFEPVLPSITVITGVPRPEQPLPPAQPLALPAPMAVVVSPTPPRDDDDEW